MYQDHDTDLPFLGDTRDITVDVQTGDVISERQPTYTYEGSYTTSILIRLSGRRVTISRGNPSKVNRIDNLFDTRTLVWTSILLLPFRFIQLRQYVSCFAFQP